MFVFMKTINKTRKKIVNKVVIDLRRSYKTIDENISLFTNRGAIDSWQRASEYLKTAVAKVIIANDHETNNW